MIKLVGRGGGGVESQEKKCWEYFSQGLILFDDLSFQFQRRMVSDNEGCVVSSIFLFILQKVMSGWLFQGINCYFFAGNGSF